ncbi:MAG: hypothetical protein GC155_11670 [Alphaproteobacteria bacterium]|nr:hypothetical protein [Alphaproteobacteria bacterium]
MTITTLVAPAVEPVGLADAKEYLRIGYDSEDELVAGLIAGARSRIETAAGLALITRTLRLTLDGWSKGTLERREVRLPVRPAAELVAIRVFDVNDVATEVTDQFILDAGRSARLVWTSGVFPWPGRRAAGIEIDFTAGFGADADDVAEDLRLAVKRLVAHAYLARDAGTLSGPLPEDVAGLLSPWRRVRL